MPLKSWGIEMYVRGGLRGFLVFSSKRIYARTTSITNSVLLTSVQRFRWWNYTQTERQHADVLSVNNRTYTKHMQFDVGGLDTNDQGISLLHTRLGYS